jgi:mono/diheme cytochrome c family protein
LQEILAFEARGEHDGIMRRSFLLLAVSMIMASGIVAACKQKTSAAQDETEDGGPGGESSSGSAMPNGDDDDTTTDQGTAAEPSNGIPCDVEAVVENRCLSCHGAVAPQGPPLLKYEDFAAMSTRDPKKTRGQVSAELMTSKEMPKAPGVATDSEIKIMNDWVSAGMQKSTEACILAPADSGAVNTTDGGPIDGGADGGLCTSGVHWTQGNTGSDLMHPGGACIACHSTTQGGPAMSFAGTVFPTLHEPDDCNGSKAPITVVVKDRRGKTVTMQTNAAGNFFVLTDAIADLNLRPPFTVEVREPGKTARKMGRTITGGDCNGCHTMAGNGPPGRVLEPGAPL